MMTPRITEMLNDPTVSHWLKEALRSAINRDCLDAAMDAELLTQLLDERYNLILRGKYNG